ncbi:hypothetical protein Cs7R123_08980 [Catellatospora sp. TT07R-123]|uniref:GTPase domain-containing protein n=1 Tax=Catellatospora sp. TT07R-123 TaxID=2733863 RepID=UPI001B0E1CBB|nr:GTPase domain-containing protein [Catellatospora sp. TT07R-123]GHJ43556.1 hypothetical protein Cs7R123_08980 [Catellatospora sp. TT07R-123]
MIIDKAERHRLATLAEQAVTELEPQRPTSPRLLLLWQQALRAAEELRAAVARNISIGFAGDVNKGKSLLITLLVDRPGLLTVADVPATGNLTRVVVRPDAAYGEDAVVGYMTPEGVVELVEYLLEGIRTHAGRSGRYGAHVLDGYHPVDAARIEQADWRLVEDLFRSWWADPTMNLKLREWATELFAVRDALRVGAGLLARTRGQLTPIRRELLDSAVLIGTSHTPTEQFPEPRYGAPISPDRMSADTLLATRSLIDQVVITVGVPRSVLDLDTAIELIDFPGLDSGSLRDRYLISRELPRTTVVAVVVDGREPTSDSVKEFFSMLEQGRHDYGELDKSMLVIGNKFDPVEPPSPVARSLRELTEHSDNVAALTAMVGELTRQHFERFALVSALRAGMFLGAPAPRGATSHDLYVARGSGDRWAPTVRSLRATHRDDPMVTALAHFTDDDGGLGHLRQLLTGHLGEHGSRIWLAEAHGLEQAYLAARQAFDDELPVRVPVGVGEQERRRLEELLRRLRTAVDHLKPRMAELVLVPTEKEFEELVEAAIVGRVHDWPCWTGHLSRIDSGLLRPGGPAGPDGDLFDGDFDDLYSGGAGGWHTGPTVAQPGEAQLLVTTADLAGSYDETRDKAMAVLDSVLTDRVRRWAVELHRSLGLDADAQTLQRHRDELRRVMLVRGGAVADGFLRNFALLLDPRLVTEEVGRQLGALPSTEADYAYPRSASTPVPWQIDHHDDEDARRDPAVLFRLRRDVVEALSHQVRRRIQSALLAAHTRLIRKLDLIGEQIPPTSVLRGLSGPPTDSAR